MIIIGEIPVTVVKKQNKHLYIRINSGDGKVVVSAPEKMSDVDIERAIKAKEDWIRKKYKQYQERLKMRGEITPDNQELMRNVLNRQISELVPVWEEKTGLHCTEWIIRDMKSRWGSCNTRTGKITFSLQLATMPEDFVEYVILHELLHLRVPNHGSDFKAELDKYMPDWKERAMIK